MLHISRNTKLGRIMAFGLIASALAPAAAPAYYDTGSRSESDAASGPTPDVVLSRSESPSATPSVTSGPTPDVILSRTDNPPATSNEVRSGATPDVILSRSDNPPATSSEVTSGPTPDVLLSRTDNPPATAEIVSVSDSGGFDWGSAGIGAAMAIGLTVLSLAGLLGIREARRSPAGS